MRRSPLRRKTALRPKPPLTSARAARKDRERLQLARFHEGCKARALGHCEASIAPVCLRRGSQAHHVVPRSRGVGWAGLHEPDNGLWVCAPCHDWIHAHPEAAALSGFLARPPR